MSSVTFGRLSDLSPREAWSHEAHAFTPWLAENIDQLSEVIGIPLELTGTEVAVENFAADILARNVEDGSVVLIENQLEQTDHTHLGQILTYLAGLDARTVVWIAPRFREPHLSAIRWLNAHTAEGFGFFAVRLRVVRIGDSPYAPVFEVLEKPSNWDRQLGVASRSVRAESPEHVQRRQAFWTMLLERNPDLARIGVTDAPASNKWLSTAYPDVLVGLYLASRTCGIYVRGRSGTSIDVVAERLLPHRQVLEEQLGTMFRSDEDPTWLLVSKIAYPLSDEAHWPEIIDWMTEHLRLYMQTFNELAARIPT